MTDYKTYVLIICFIVFAMLTTLSVVCISLITHLQLKLIGSGVEDSKILAEYEEKQKEEQSKKHIGRKILGYVLSGMVCLAFVVSFLISMSIGAKENNPVGDIPVYRVVKTNSMSVKNAGNTYLEENGLDDQIQTFDLIRTEKLPDEMDLELYDIVVYETDGMLIVHRIVEIEEPNAAHPDCRYFRVQGDAIDAPDRFPVKYEQMRAIYRGHRIPFVGSFILFMQSPAGWLCALLVLIAMIAAPILDAIIAYNKRKRVEDYMILRPWGRWYV